MPEATVKTQKKQAASTNSAGQKSSASQKSASSQKSLETRVTEALNKQDKKAVMEALQGASVSEIMQLAQNKSLMEKYNKLFPSTKSDPPKSWWDKVTDAGAAAWNWTKETGKSALHWANEKATSAATTYLSPESIMDIYSALSTGNFISNKTIKEHIQGNTKELKKSGQLDKALHGSSYYTRTGYIENQGSGNWDKIKYGSSNLSDAGCGIFATFNVIKAVTGTTPTEADLVDIIANYEQDGAIVHGAAGTSPKAIRAYLIKKGFTVETVNEFGDAKLNEIGNKYKGFVTLKLNSKTDITAGGHYESISKTSKSEAERKKEKDANGKASKFKFSIHNGSKRGPHNSLPKAVEVINGDNAFIFCILAVNKSVK